MRRVGTSVAQLLILLLAALPASAQGINLRWTECVADGGMRNAIFACNTNSGQRVLVTSFVLPGPVTASSGVSGVIDIIAADVTLPDWWNFRVCRSGSLGASLSAIAPALCADVYGACSGSVGVSAILPGVPAVNGERLQFSRTFCKTGPPPILYPDLAPGVEYIAIPLTINFTRTLGSPSCGGCSTPVCMTLTQMQVSATTPAGGVTLTIPALLPDGNFVTWQGGGPGPGGTCQAATPTRRAIWGSVKALYR